MPILKTAALHAFWKIPKTALLSVCRKAKAPACKATTLFGVVLHLAKFALPSHSDEQLVDILAQRIPVVDPLQSFLCDNGAADMIEAMPGDDRKEMEKTKQDVVKSQAVATPFVSEFNEYATKHGRSGKSSGKRAKAEKQAQERLVRGPMFQGLPKCEELLRFLPPWGEYRLRQDDFNGRWQLSRGSTYVASFSYLRYGFAEAGVKACEVAWDDASGRGGAECPWRSQPRSSASASSASAAH